MATYKMSDGMVVKTENASAFWKDGQRWDGRNLVSMATNSQWEHQTLYRSRKGRYYIEHMTGCPGRRPRAEWVSNEEATRWLLANEHESTDEDFPAELLPLVGELSE
jgi:hypothetical protein